MLTHNNFMSNVLSITRGLPIGPTDVALSVFRFHIFLSAPGFMSFATTDFRLLRRLIRSNRRESARGWSYGHDCRSATV